MIRKRILALVPGVAVVVAASVAEAAPFAFDLPSSAGTLTVAIDVTGGLGGGAGTGSASAHFSGDLTDTTLTLGASSISLSDITTAGTGLFGVLEIDGVVASVSNPNTLVGADYEFDIGGTTLTLISGTVVAPAVGNAPLLDFSLAPVSLTLAPGIATFRNDLFAFPISAQVALPTLLQVVTATVSGDIVWIPEPGTLLLVAAGLAGLSAATRRADVIRHHRSASHRRRTRQRGEWTIMRPTRILGWASALAVVAATSVASAAPISPPIDPSFSSLDIAIAGGALGGSSGTGAASGFIHGDLTGDTFTLGSNSISVSDITTAGSGLLGTLLINGVAATISNPNPIVGVGGVFDLTGSTLILTSGVVVIPALGNLTAFDFSTAPTSLTLGAVLATLSGGILTIPVAAQVTFSTLNSVVTVTVSGYLGVPEQRSLVLVSAGLAAVAAVTRARA